MEPTEETRPRRPVYPALTAAWWRLFFSSLGDALLITLIVCAFLSITINLIFSPPEERSIGWLSSDLAWVEGFSILLAVLICAIVTATNDFQKEQKFQALYELSSTNKTADVLRSGARTTISAREIVVGDIIFLEAGMLIQADGVLLESNSMEVDESSLIGESEHRIKDSIANCVQFKEAHASSGESDEGGALPSPFLLSGTLVTALLPRLWQVKGSICVWGSGLNRRWGRYKR